MLRKVPFRWFDPFLTFSAITAFALLPCPADTIHATFTNKGIEVDLGDPGTFNFTGPLLQAKDATTGKMQSIKPVFTPAADGLSGTIDYPGSPGDFKIATTISPTDHTINFHYDQSPPSAEALAFSAAFDAGQFRGGGQFAIGGKPMTTLPLEYIKGDSGPASQLDLVGRDGIGFTLTTPEGFSGFGDDRKFNDTAQTYKWSLQFRFDPAKYPNGFSFTLRDKQVAVTPPTPLPPGPPADGSKWVPIPEMTDDFNGTTLDTTKWYDHNPGWAGHSPSFFAPNNVTVADGNLKLLARLQDKPASLAKFPGYKNYSTGTVISKATALYGYFECRAKVMNINVNNAFWFFTPLPDPPGNMHIEEMDVFEINGGNPKFNRTLFDTMHVWRTPETGNKKPWVKKFYFRAPKVLSDDYHIYAMDWEKDAIKCYFDGVLFAQYQNTNWHLPLDLIFDNEVAVQWFGLPPADSTFNGVFNVDYVHAWRHADDAGAAATSTPVPNAPASAAPPSATP
jgi:beta-glucanase (GH16 family)